MSGFFLLFDVLGYFPWQIHLEKVPSHAPRKFTAVKLSRVTAPNIFTQFDRNPLCLNFDKFCDTVPYKV